MMNNGSYFMTKRHILNMSEWYSYKNGIKNRIRKGIVYTLKNLFYKAVVRFLPQKMHARDRKYHIGICSIFKNEAPFLKEFIVYHKMIGVDHFYLYNNNSTDNFQEVLFPFIEQGLVTLTEWPIKPGQIPAYKHWYENYRQECDWCSFLDLDEYICPSFMYDLPSWLEGYSKYPVIKIDWLMFGSNGMEKHDNSRLVIEQYTSCWNKKSNVGKLLYNCHYDIYEFNRGMMHNLHVKYGFLVIPTFNTSHNILYRSYELVGKHQDTIQINHYYCKAYDILTEKINRGSAAYAKSWKKSSVFWLKEMNCTSTDSTIFKYLLKMKLMMGNKEILKLNEQ